MQKIIYDVGANNGDDIPYYLMKAEVVVAIEANPALCEIIGERFSAEIDAGRLIVENCAVTADDVGGEVDFYIHRDDHVVSQMLAPKPEVAERFDRVRLPSSSIVDIIARRGAPFYVKIDVEHYDAMILRSLFQSGIRPPYISAESHSAEVFSLLVALGGYDSFKLVDGRSVSTVYSNCVISDDVTGDSVQYSFPHHSAGPFGDDVKGEWMTAENFFRLLAFEGLGWKDVHATSVVTADPSVCVLARNYIWRDSVVAIRQKMPKSVRRLKRLVRSPKA